MGININPRKQLRININHLDREMTVLRERLRKFEVEKNYLYQVEKTGSEAEAKNIAKDWNYLDWLAFPA